VVEAGGFVIPRWEVEALGLVGHGVGFVELGGQFFILFVGVW